MAITFQNIGTAIVCIIQVSTTLNASNSLRQRTHTSIACGYHVYKYNYKDCVEPLWGWLDVEKLTQIAHNTFSCKFSFASGDEQGAFWNTQVHLSKKEPSGGRCILAGRWNEVPRTLTHGIYETNWKGYICLPQIKPTCQLTPVQTVIWRGASRHSIYVTRTSSPGKGYRWRPLYWRRHDMITYT